MKEINFESNIWKYYCFEFFMGLWFTLPISVIFLRNFNITYGSIGFIEFIAALVVVLLEIPTGTFSDFMGRKITLLIASLFWCVAMLTIGFGSTLPMFLLGFILWAISDSLLSGTKSAFIYDTLKRFQSEKQYLRIKGISSFIESISIIVASILGSYLYSVNVRLPWIFFGASAFLASIFILLSKEPYKKNTRFTIPNQIKHMKESVAFVIKNEYVRWIIVFASVIILPFSIFNNILKQPYILYTGFQVISLGWITALIYGLSGVTSLYSRKIENYLGKKSSFLIITLLHGIGFLLLGLFRSEPMILVIIVIYICRSYKDNILELYINKNVDSSKRTTVLSISNLTVSLFSAFYILIGGRLLDLYNIQAVLVGIGIAVTALGLPIIFLRFFKEDIRY